MQKKGGRMDAVAAMGLTLKPGAVVAEPEQEEGTFIMDVPDETGHEHLVWSKRIPEQMKEAQKKFYELLDKGFKLFAVRIDGKKESRPMLRFDPLVEHVLVERVVAIAPVRGG